MSKLSILDQLDTLGAAAPPKVTVESFGFQPDTHQFWQAIRVSSIARGLNGRCLHCNYRDFEPAAPPCSSYRNLVDGIDKKTAQCHKCGESEREFERWFDIRDEPTAEAIEAACEAVEQERQEFEKTFRRERIAECKKILSCALVAHAAGKEPDDWGVRWSDDELHLDWKPWVSVENGVPDAAVFAMPFAEDDWVVIGADDLTCVECSA